MPEGGGTVLVRWMRSIANVLADCCRISRDLDDVRSRQTSHRSVRHQRTRERPSIHHELPGLRNLVIPGVQCQIKRHVTVTQRAWLMQPRSC